jgi:succinate dehydrogenase/fumarate reductase flavoprotein subunit
MATEVETHAYDVIVIGAGGAGLRAAIAAHDAGAKTAVICKSLLGKAHTVMAEGGIAAAMGNLWPEDNWQVHFRDTMRGGLPSGSGSSSSGVPCSTGPQKASSASVTSGVTAMLAWRT